MMNRRCRRCCCINNNYSNSNVQNALANQGVLETACNEPCSYPTYNQDCGCGFDEYDNIFPENPMLAQSYTRCSGNRRCPVAKVIINLGVHAAFKL